MKKMKMMIHKVLKMKNGNESGYNDSDSDYDMWLLIFIRVFYLICKHI